MDNIKIDYSIGGHINSRPVEGRGIGLIDFSSGVNELEIEFSSLAASWDPRTIVLMCCDRVTKMGTRALAGAVGLYEASGGYASIGRHITNDFRRAKVVNKSNEILVDVQASSLTDLRSANSGGRGRDESRIEGGISHLTPGQNGVAAIRKVSGLMQQTSPNMITVATAYEIELEDGSTAFGNTYYPHFLPEPKIALTAPQIWRMEQVKQEFDGKRLWVQTVTSVAPLAEVGRQDAGQAAGILTQIR